jgi:hypothetical protein
MLAFLFLAKFSWLENFIIITIFSKWFFFSSFLVTKFQQFFILKNHQISVLVSSI